MTYLIRPIAQDDEPFLWKMLYYAAHMDEDSATSFLAAKDNPDLIKYAEGWGLAHLIEAIKDDYPAVMLSVRTTNPAKRLYERMGFVVMSNAINRVGTASVNMLLRFK